MKLFKLGLILTFAALFIFSCSQNQTGNANVNGNSAANTTAANTTAKAPANQAPANSAGNDELAAARKIYSEKCVKCHKEDGTGGVTDIEGTKIKAPNFHSDHMMNDKDADWIDTIENGAKEDGMPAYKGKISDEEIKNLVKLIRKDFQGK